MICTDNDFRRELDEKIRTWFQAHGKEWVKKPIHNNIRPLMDEVVESFVERGCKVSTMEEIKERVTKRLVTEGIISSKVDLLGGVYPLTDVKGFNYYS